MTMNEMGARAKTAARALANAGPLKETALLRAAQALWERREELLAANAQDMEAGKERGMSRALLDRLAGEKNGTPAQISLAWMLCKKPWIVPIPGTRRVERMKENAGAADIRLTAAEVAAIDRALDETPMSAVFGGSQIVKG